MGGQGRQERVTPSKAKQQSSRWDGRREASKEHASLYSISGWLTCAPDNFHKAACVYNLTACIPSAVAQGMGAAGTGDKAPGLIRVGGPECDVSHRDSLMSDLWIIPRTGYKFLVTPGSLSVLGFLIYLSCKDRAI